MEVWKISDVGISRQGNPNEDTCFVETLGDGAVLAVVCDGMGGANAGEVASGMAAGAFRETFLDGYKKWSRDGAKKRMIASVKSANDKVFDAAIKDDTLTGMGTTVVAAAVSDDGEAVLANVGDSRAYILTEDGIKQVTTDHSLVNEMIMRGEITKAEAHRHPSRNLITRAIGVEPEVKCDCYYIKVDRGDYLLLCSDGLNDQVSEPEIYYEVYESGHPETACRSLVEVANARGGSDNVTIILIAV